MSDGDNIVPFPTPTRAQSVGDVCFNRIELGKILSIYGRFVAAGEWRDYAIDHKPDHALFSIYRRASERPLFSIEKRPANAARQGAFCVFGHDGRVLKRGKDLEMTLRIFNRALLKLTRPE